MASSVIRDRFFRAHIDVSVSGCNFCQVQPKSVQFSKSRKSSNYFAFGFSSVFSSSAQNSSSWLQLRAPNPIHSGPAFKVYCVVTDKIVGGAQLTASSDPNLRRLILLRHAKSSWSDRSIKGMNFLHSDGHNVCTDLPRLFVCCSYFFSWSLFGCHISPMKVVHIPS